MGGIMGAGGAGEANNYKVFNLTTHGTANTEKSEDLGQTVFTTKIYNDTGGDLLVGFDNDTSQANKVHTIKNGELFEIELVYQTLYYKSAQTSAGFRVFVTW